MLSLDRQNELREAYRLAHPGWRPATEVFAGWVRAELNPDSRLLDLGCGRGGLVEQLHHPLHRIYGLDPDYLSLREHRLARATPPLARINGASDRLPFAAASFDVAYASWVLEHMARPEQDFAELGRVLKPGGAFVFITPNRRHPLIGFNRFAGQIGGLQDRLVGRLYGRAAADTYPAHYLANTPDQIAKLAGTAGLLLEKMQFVPDPSYLAFRLALFRLLSLIEGFLPESRAIHLVGLVRKP
jgi:ubiquinone/menaquinone biosynthesis C-methylase UbiE